MPAQLYTQEQLEIALLKESSSVTAQSLGRIEHRLDKVDEEIKDLDKKIDSHFKWQLSVIGAVGITLLGSIVQHWLK
jgi:hypothetical protein